MKSQRNAPSYREKGESNGKAGMPNYNDAISSYDRARKTANTTGDLEIDRDLCGGERGQCRNFVLFDH